MKQIGTTRWWHAPACGFAVLLYCGLGCGRSGQLDSVENVRQVSQQTSLMRPSDVASIRVFCGDCHAVPLSTSFAKGRWEHEVDQGFRLYRESGREDLIEPDRDATIAYFRDQAPQTIEITQEPGKQDQRFQRVAVPSLDSMPLESISACKLVSNGSRSNKLVMADMSGGAVVELTISFDEPVGKLPAASRLRTQWRKLAQVAHPASIEVVDFDHDGLIDLVVADLGTLNPQPEQQGTVWLLRNLGDGGYERIPLQLGLSRAAVARAINLKGSDVSGLLVADFGLHFVGSTSLLTNEGRQGVSRFNSRVLDPRPGTIELSVTDFNQDGIQDYLSLTSQHHESIDVAIGGSDGTFDRKTVFESGDPAFGSSGMQVIDFDFDGDLDVLYTNGDTFDDGLAKPFHGITLLENRDEFPFMVHPVGRMPGCYNAVAGDIDLDGDLDIVAVALLEPGEVDKYPPDTFDSIVWFEQQENYRFVRHRIKMNQCQAARCVLFDADGDGDLDIFIPPFSSSEGEVYECELYLNRTNDIETD